jgi:tagatose 1,6-diphosphate aldolase
LIQGWSLAKAKRMGASASKLLVYYNPTIPSVARIQEDFVRSLADQAKELDLPLLLEPMSYSPIPDIPKKSKEFAQLRPQIVLDTVINLGKLGVDLLKLEFPCDVNFESDESVWFDACRQITNKAPVPWVLLSAGVNFDIFKKQLIVACKAGASGFVAGRAIWKEAAGMGTDDRKNFLKDTGAMRIRELAAVVSEYAKPWKEKLREKFIEIDRYWLKEYKTF